MANILRARTKEITEYLKGGESIEKCNALEYACNHCAKDGQILILPVEYLTC